MVFMEKAFKCTGCGREKKAFFPSGAFKLQLREWAKNGGFVEEYSFCSWSCLRKWLAREAIK